MQKSSKKEAKTRRKNLALELGGILVNFTLCQFNESGTICTPKVHDCFVVSLNVEMEKAELTLVTEYRLGVDTPIKYEIKFRNVLAHHLDTIGSVNILNNISNEKFEQFYDLWETEFDRGRPSHWPIENESKEDLIAQLKTENINFYHIDAVAGLIGFVLAGDVEFRSNGNRS